MSATIRQIATQAEFDSRYIPPKEPNSQEVKRIQNQLNEAINEAFGDDTAISKMLMRELSLSQFGIKSMIDLKQFLAKPLGQRIQAIIGKNALLEKYIQESKLLQAIQQFLGMKLLKAFFLLDTYRQLNKQKLHALMISLESEKELKEMYERIEEEQEQILAEQAEKHLSFTTTAAATGFEVTADTISALQEDIIHYNTLCGQYFDNHNYQQYLERSTAELTTLKTNVDSELLQCKASDDIASCHKMLTSTTPEDNTAEKRAQLRSSLQEKFQSMQKELYSLNAGEVDPNEYNPDRHKALLIAARVIKDYMIRLAEPETLKQLQNQLDQIKVKLEGAKSPEDYAQLHKDFANYLEALNEAGISTELEMADIMDTVVKGKLFENKDSNPKALEAFFDSLKRQTSKRTYLGKNGEPLTDEQAKDMSNVYYGLPEGCTAQTIDNAVYMMHDTEKQFMMDPNDPGKVFLDKHRNPYLAEQGKKIIVENDEVFLVDKDCDFGNLDAKGKQEAARDARKAMQSARDARSLAEEYALTDKNFSIAVESIKNNMTYLENDQKALFQEIKQKETSIEEKYQASNTLDVTPRPTPQDVLSELELLLDQAEMANTNKPGAKPLPEIAKDLQRLFASVNLSPKINFAESTKNNCQLGKATLYTQIKSEIQNLSGIMKTFIDPNATERNEIEDSPTHKLPSAFDIVPKPPGSD